MTAIQISMYLSTPARRQEPRKLILPVISKVD